MQTYVETLQAGVPLTVNVPGRYFRLISTGAPLDVEFLRRGRTIEKGGGIEAGYYSQPINSENENLFDALILTSATAQTIKYVVSVGAGGYDRFYGNVDINRPAVTTYQSGGILAAGGNVQLLAPAANVNGIVIHDWQLATQSAAGGHAASLQAKTTAPTVLIHGQVIGLCVPTVTGQAAVRGMTGSPYRLAAGLGLYAFSIAQENSALASRVVVVEHLP